MKAFLAFLLSGFLGIAQSLESNLDSSFCIKTEDGNGSGSAVLVQRTNVYGDVLSFFWTAAHVIEDERVETEIVTPDGIKRTLVTYKPLYVVEKIYQNGNVVGRTEYAARVLKSGNKATGDDIAVLVLLKTGGIPSQSAVFTKSNNKPRRGDKIYHVGSYYGMSHEGSYSEGVISYTDRVSGGFKYDQVSGVTILPGSSGGAVFSAETHECLGLVAMKLTAAATVGFVVPARQIRPWADRNGVAWAFDPAVPAPAKAELAAIQPD